MRYQILLLFIPIFTFAQASSNSSSTNKQNATIPSSKPLITKPVQQSNIPQPSPSVKINASKVNSDVSSVPIKKTEKTITQNQTDSKKMPIKPIEKITNTKSQNLPIPSQVKTIPEKNTQEPVLEDSPALNAYFENTETNNSIDTTADTSLPSAWGPFFFLAFIMLGIYAGIKFVRKKMLRLKQISNPVDFIHTVASIPITNNAQLAIVNMAGQFFLFGITAHSMQMIMEITDPDLVLKIQTIPKGGEPKPFKEIFLELFGSRNTKNITAPDSEDQFKKFIEEQKNRIGGIK